MSAEHRTVASSKAQLSKFSGIISKGFRKPKRRLVKEMLYWIQASKDVKLSNISRPLKEGQALIKTEDRLSRNLDDEDFTDSINEEILQLSAPRVTADMVIAIDFLCFLWTLFRKRKSASGICMFRKKQD
jgi:hypothetical protein